MGIEGPSLNQEKSQALPQEELSSAQERFAKGLLSVAGVTTLEDAQKADWKFDSAYLSTGRESESTNYQVVPMEGSEQKVEDSTSRRCTLCHQPIKEVNLVGVNGQVVQMGNDCTAKLIRFIDTGEIVAENPRKEMLAEQSEILLEGAQYERGILEKEREALRWTDKEGYKKIKRITDGKIVASMMTWLIDHVEDEDVPEEVAYAIRSYNSMGMMPTDKFAREVSEYYKSARKFLPDELLKDEEVRGLKYHPHKGLLRNVIKEGVVQNDLPQFKRIIEKGNKVRSKKNSEATTAALQNAQLEYKKRVKIVEVVPPKRTEQSYFLEESSKILEAVRHEGLIERGEFSEPRDVFDRMGRVFVVSPIYKIRPGMHVDLESGETPGVPHDLPLNSFYEFDEDYEEQVGYLYTLDQRAYDYLKRRTAGSYFVIVEEHEVGVKNVHTQSQIDQLNAKISRGVIRSDSEIQTAIVALPKTETIVHEYSCAEVVVDPKTMQPVVLLKEGDVPLVQAIEEGKVLEWPE